LICWKKPERKKGTLEGSAAQQAQEHVALVVLRAEEDGEYAQFASPECGVFEPTMPSPVAQRVRPLGPDARRIYEDEIRRFGRIDLLNPAIHGAYALNCRRTKER
jgi:hypothetical protein